jgi:hypothetical protein
MPEIVWGLLPPIRASLSGKKMPSEGYNIVGPVDISVKYNFTKTQKKLL